MENNSLSMKCEMRVADGYVESSAEYVLPDYNTDVRKILCTSCEVKPAGKIASDDQVDFSGIVEYRCLYADKDGEISEVRFTSDYEYGVSLAADAEDACSHPWVQNYQIRVLGPRKMSAKASIACENVCTVTKGATSGGIPSGDDIELDRRSVRVGRLATVESAEREMAEEIMRIDGVALDEITVVSGATECSVGEFTRGDEEGKCRSEFLVKLIYRDRDGQLIPVEHSIVGEGDITLDGIPAEAQVVCTPRVLSERFECTPTDDGVSIVANLIVKWDAVCVYNDEHSVVCDAYSTECALDNKYATLSLINYGATMRERLCADGTLSLDGGEGGKVKEVLLIGGRARVVEKKMEGGRLDVSVEIKAQGVVSTYDNNGATAYVPVKISDTIQKKVNISSQKQGVSGAMVRISGVNISHKIDGDDIKYTACVDVDIIPYDEACVRVLDSGERNENEKIEKKAGRVTVYYSEPGDTLFSVAKKYHTSITSMLENNDIAAETALGEGGVALPKRIIIY